MRYMLLLHFSESDLDERTPEWVEEAVGFLSRFEDELAVRSELEWAEVLASEAHAELVGPGGERRLGRFNAEGAPLGRLWVVRVDDEARVRELAGLLAGELDAWIEVRECLPGSQRP